MKLKNLFFILLCGITLLSASLYFAQYNNYEYVEYEDEDDNNQEDCNECEEMIRQDMGDMYYDKY